MKKRKKVLLITSSYPYGKGESFLDAELRTIASSENITIIPTIYNGSLSIMHSVPDGITVDRLFDTKMTVFEKLLMSFKAIFTIDFMNEVYILIKQNRLNLNILYWLIQFCMHGERIAKNIDKKYGRDLNNCSNEYVLYSYWMSFSAYGAAKLKNKYGCKAITRVHGGDLYDDRGKFNYQPIRKFLIQSLNKVYSVSEIGKKYINDKYGGGNRVDVSYLGTNDNGERSLSIKKAAFVIASCAHMVPLKRIELLVQALSEITERQIRWIHFGDGPERLGIEKMIKEILPTNIEVNLFGNVPHNDVMKYYKNNDVHLFVNTSTTEGIPVSIMEAISFGIPTIATDVGGTREVVYDGYNGFCVSKSIDAKELSVKIKKFIYMENETYYTYRYNARKYWQEHFSSKKNYEAFYDDVRKLNP
jgi:colanic acid/amylovoran biosynthesis glycosyltransferase